MITSKKENLTILDIAELAHVGKSTVSRVINHDKNVSEATRKKVMKIIDQYHFVPDQSARSLRGKDSKLIAILCTRLDASSENQAIHAILKQFNEYGFNSVVLETQFSIEITKKTIYNLLKNNIDGFIIFATGKEDYDFLKAIDKPFIMIGQKVSGFCSICYDDYGAIEKICALLYDRGKRNIAFLGVSEEDPTTGYLRKKAYLDFMERKQLPSMAYICDFSYESSYQKMDDIRFRELDAIVCATDNIALGVKKYLYEQGHYNISVTGVGGKDIHKFIFPEIISANLNFYKSGALAADLINKALDGEIPIETITLTSDLIV